MELYLIFWSCRPFTQYHALAYMDPLPNNTMIKRL